MVFPDIQPFVNVAWAGVEEAWPVVGIDVSKWQVSMDWEKAKTLIQFAYIRAGIGNDVLDTEFARNVIECQRLEITHGLYWYIKPDKDWRRTAASFANAYNSYGGDLPPVFDIEDGGGLGKTALESWLCKCVTEFENLVHTPVMIYTSTGFWNANMPLTNWAKNRQLWIASWTTAAAPSLPAEWGKAINPRTWKFWQFSADGNGMGATYGAESVSIDLNRYHGTVAQFNQEYGVSLPLPPPPVEPPPPVVLPAPYIPLKLVCITAASTLNIRAQPTAAALDIGDLKRDSIVPVYGEFGDWYDTGGGWIHRSYTKDA